MFCAILAVVPFYRNNGIESEKRKLPQNLLVPIFSLFFFPVIYPIYPLSFLLSFSPYSLPMRKQGGAIFLRTSIVTRRHRGGRT
jgi:hypothetical protein